MDQSRPERDADAADRLRLTLELADMAERMLRQTLRRKHPDAPADQIESMIDAWYARRPGAEHGDADGIPRPWPPRG